MSNEVIKCQKSLRSDIKTNSLLLVAVYVTRNVTSLPSSLVAVFTWCYQTQGKESTGENKAIR